MFHSSSSSQPAEVFRKDLISAMKLPDSHQLQPEEYWVIQDQWKQEWEKGVQVPVDDTAINEPQFFEVLMQDSGTFELPDKFIKCYSGSEEQMKQAEERQRQIEATCQYDLDEVDIQWLHIINREREDMGESPIDELTMEKIIEQCEIQCQKNIEHALQTEEGLGIEYDEDICCAVCRAPDSEEDNEMVFCDKCDICVHQACYGVVKIPEGSWMCRVCALGLQPECMLCGKKGGAMKSTRSGTKWAHVNCALWVPEVSIGDVERMEPITNIFQIPASRWALICNLCRERTGACIQCSVKTCKTAYHVTCAVEHNLEMEQQLDENKDVKFRSYCLKHTNLRKSPNSDGTVKPSPRKKSEEEKANARALRIQKVTEEFQKFVKMKEVAASLNFKDDLEVVDLIFEYWKLKRKSGFNKPLLSFPREDDKDKNSEEYNLHARMKMFVHLRQDLERVRNLCYMVQRREKLSRQMLRLREGLFKKQCEFFNGNISRMTEEEVDWAARAGEISARVPFPMSEDVILNKWLSIPSDGPKLMLDDDDDSGSEEDSDLEMEAKKERDKKKREKAAARKKKEAEATARLKEKLAQVKGPVSSNTRGVKHRRVSSMDGKIIYEDEVRSRKGGTPNSYVSDTSSVIKEEGESEKSDSVEPERENRLKGDSSEVKTSESKSPERNNIDEKKTEKNRGNENRSQKSKTKNPVKGVKSENFKERPISKNKQENREDFKKHRKKDKMNSIHNHKLDMKSPPAKRKSIENKDKDSKHSINKKDRKLLKDPKQRNSLGRQKTPVLERSSEKNHIKQDEKLHFLGRGLEVKEEWTYWQTSEQRKLQSEKEVRHDEDKNAAEFLLQEVMDDKDLTPITPFEDGNAKPVIDDFIERHTEDQSAADFLANEIFDEKISNQDVKDKFTPLVGLLEKEQELMAAERLLNGLDDEKIVDWKCNDLLNSKSEKIIENSLDVEIRRDSVEDKAEDLLPVENVKVTKNKDSKAVASSDAIKRSKGKVRTEKKESHHPERTEKDVLKKNHRKSDSHKEKKKLKTGKDHSVSREGTSVSSQGTPVTSHVSNKKESISGKDLAQSESARQNGRCEKLEKDTSVKKKEELDKSERTNHMKMKKRKEKHQKEKRLEGGGATKEVKDKMSENQEKSVKSPREECNKKMEKSSKKTSHSGHKKENKSQKPSVDNRRRESKGEVRHAKKDKHAKEKEANWNMPKPSKHRHEKADKEKKAEKEAESGKERKPSRPKGIEKTASEKTPRAVEKKKKERNSSKESLSSVTPLVLNDSSSVEKLERSEKQKHVKSKRDDVDKQSNRTKQIINETGKRKDMPVLPVEKRHDLGQSPKLTKHNTCEQKVSLTKKDRKQSKSKPADSQLNGEESFKEPRSNDDKRTKLTHEETNGNEGMPSLVSQVEDVPSDGCKLSIFDVQGIDDAYHEDKSVDTNNSASIFDWDPSEQLFEPERRQSSRRASSVSSERSSQADAESTDDSEGAVIRKSKRRKKESPAEALSLADTVNKGTTKQMLELRRLSRRRGSLSSDRSSLADSTDDSEEVSSNTSLKSARKTSTPLSVHSTKSAKSVEMPLRKESVDKSQNEMKKRKPSSSKSVSSEKCGKDATGKNDVGKRVVPDSRIVSRDNSSDQKIIEDCQTAKDVSVEECKAVPSKSAPISERRKSSSCKSAVSEVGKKYPPSQRISKNRRASLDRAEVHSQGATEEKKMMESHETFTDTFNGNVPASSVRLDKNAAEQRSVAKLRASSERVSSGKLRKEELKGKKHDEVSECPNLVPQVSIQVPEHPPQLGNSQFMPQVPAEVPQQNQTFDSSLLIPQLPPEVPQLTTPLDNSEFMPQIPPELSQQNQPLDSSLLIPQIPPELPLQTTPLSSSQVSPQVPLEVPVPQQTAPLGSVQLSPQIPSEVPQQIATLGSSQLIPQILPELPQQSTPLSSSQLIPQLAAQVSQDAPRVGSPHMIPQLTPEVSVERSMLDGSHFIPQLPGQAPHETPDVGSPKGIPQLTAEVSHGMPTVQSPQLIPQLAPQVPPEISHSPSLVPPGMFPMNDSWIGQKTSLEKMEDLLETSGIDSFTPQREQLAVQVTKAEEMFNFAAQPLGEAKSTRAAELFDVPHNSYAYKGVPSLPAPVVNRRSSSRRQAALSKNVEVPQGMIPNRGLQTSGELKSPILDILSSDFSELPLELNAMTTSNDPRKTGNIQTLLTSVPGLSDKKETAFVGDIVRDSFEPLEKGIEMEPLSDMKADLVSSQPGPLSWRSEDDVTCPAKLPINKGIRRRSVPVATPEKSEPMTVPRNLRRNSSVVADRQYQNQLNYPVHEMALFNPLRPSDGVTGSPWEPPRMVNSQSVLDNYTMSEKINVSGDKLFRMSNRHIQNRSDPPSSKQEGSWREILDNMPSDSGQFGWNPSDLPEFITPIPPSIVPPFSGIISNNVSFVPEPQKTEKSFPEDKAPAKEDVEMAKEKEVQQTSDKSSVPLSSENGVYFHKKLSLSLNQRRREERCKTRDSQDSLTQENLKLSHFEALSSADHSKVNVCKSVTSSDAAGVLLDTKGKGDEKASLPGDKDSDKQGSGDSGGQGNEVSDVPSSPKSNSVKKDEKERGRFSRRLRERKKASDSETDVDVQQSKSTEKRKVDENRNLTDKSVENAIDAESTGTQAGIIMDLSVTKKLSAGITEKDPSKPSDPLAMAKKSSEITNVKEGKQENVQSLTSPPKRVSDKQVLSPKKEDGSSKSLGKRHLLTNEFNKHIRGSPMKPGRAGGKKSSPPGKKRTPGRRSKRQKTARDGKEKSSGDKSKGGVFDFTSDEDMDEPIPVKLSKPQSPRVLNSDGRNETTDVTSLVKKADVTATPTLEQEKSDAIHGESLVSTSPQILSDSQGDPQNTLTKTEVSERSEIQPMTVNSNSSEINPIKKRWLSSGKERRNVSEREGGGKRLALANEDGSCKKSVVTSGKEKVASLTTTTSLGQLEGEQQDGERRRSLRVKTKEKEALALSLEKAKEEEGPVNERRASLRARKKDIPATNHDRESDHQEESSPQISTCPSKSEETQASLAESKDDLAPPPLSDKGEQDVVENSSTLKKEDENSKECLKEEIDAQTQSQESDIAGEISESSSHSDLRIEGADGRLVIKNWGKFTQKRKKKKKKKRSPSKEGYSTGSHTSNILDEGSSFCIKEASDGPKNGIRLKITTLERYFNLKPSNKSTQLEEKDGEQGSENLNGEPTQTPIKLRISKSLLSPSYKSPKRKHSKLESESASKSQQQTCPEQAAEGTTELTKDDKPQPMDVDVFDFDSHSSAAMDEIPKTNLGTPKPILPVRCAEELNQSTASTVISPFDSPSPKANVTEKRELCYVSFSESDHSSDGEKPRRKRRRKNKEKKVTSNSDPNSISDTLQFLSSEIT